MSDLPPENPPQTPEQQAAQEPRTLTEQALLALFILYITPTPGIPMPPLPEGLKVLTKGEIALLRRMFTVLVGGLVMNLYWPEAGVGDTDRPTMRSRNAQDFLAAQRNDTAIAALIDRKVEEGLPRVLKRTTDVFNGLADEPPRDVGELSLQRQAARDLATIMYGLAVDEVLPELPAQTGAGMLTKTWLSAGDSRVRPLHARLHGQTRPVSGDFWRFPVTGERIRFPGDPEAPIDQVIGCRCVLWLNYTKG